MLREGQTIDGWLIACIDYPVGKETWVHPPGWKMVALTGPEDEFVILNLSPEDQTPGRISTLLQEELASRSSWIGKTLTL